jgi:Holliday junction resolvase RusA-like endonuclease
MCEQEKSATEIAEYIGCNVSTVYAKCKKYGVHTTRKQTIYDRERYKAFADAANNYMKRGRMKYLSEKFDIPIHLIFYNMKIARKLGYPINKIQYGKRNDL